VLGVDIESHVENSDCSTSDILGACRRPVTVRPGPPAFLLPS